MSNNISLAQKSMNRYFLAALHTCSIILLGFGLVLNMLRIEISANFFIEIQLFQERRSILGTLQSLWEGNNFLPFLLIFLFGIIIPLAKSGMIFYLLFTKKQSHNLLGFIAAIGKWAMADVFAISIFVAFLGAKAMRNTTAFLEPGFYCFTGYVLLSGLVVFLLTKNTAKANAILS